MASQPNPQLKDQEDKFPPSPSLLSRVKAYWKENLPKAYSQFKPGELEKLVQSAEEQIGLAVSQGVSLSGANELVYPSLFPEPEDSDRSESQDDQVLS